MAIFARTYLQVSTIVMETPATANAQQCIKELLSLRDSFDALSGKWKIPLLQYLCNREHEENNFRKIQKGIPGISDKMLAKELKELERNYLVRKEIRELPANAICYHISAYGKTAIPVIKMLIEWGKEHRKMAKSMLRVL